MEKLPDNLFDIIIADPPYNIGKDFGNKSDKQNMEEYVKWSKKWIKEAFRVLSENGTIYIYGFSEILAHISVNIKYDKRWLIWHYTNKNIPSLNFWQRSHESIICSWKNTPIFNKDLVREPYTELFLNNAAGKVRRATGGRFSKGDKETIYNAHDCGALPRDVIKIGTLAGGKGSTERFFYCKWCNNIFPSKDKPLHKEHEIIIHPTQKPNELTRKLILGAYDINKKSKILIPFAGSGSECFVAKQLGLDFLGFEINKDYVKLGNSLTDRINNFL
ncbi:MAG: site-specific DNA-methyltransferase [Candidatus Gracilibacteria bacterium]|nr:site-specific DNA-methyltransferase [Candidatus Gracilibacteria bacterium]